MSVALVPTVEDAGVAGKQRAHHARQRQRGGADQQVYVVGDERLGVDENLAGGRERGHAPAKVIAIAVVEKDGLAIDAARHHHGAARRVGLGEDCEA